MNDFFPTVCVDNFFDDPQSIKTLSSFFPYEKCPEGIWPGERTESLHILCEEVYNQFFSRFFRLYYNFDFEPVNWKASLFFHKTKPYGEDRELNCGWIHNDDDCVVGGLVYLNEDNDLDAGTSIFSCLDTDKYLESTDRVELKRKLYRGDELDIEDYKKRYRDFESNFVETSRFQNVYNRLVAYDGNTYHRANSFNGVDEKERLALVFFVFEVNAQTVPLRRNEHSTNTQS